MAFVVADKIGIYEIRCAVSGKSYVGSSKRIYRRWADHRRDLRKGSHTSPRLQRAWNKHGEENFAFLILEECGRDELFVREQFHIDAKKRDYNSMQRVQVFTKEMRAKARASLLALYAGITHCPAGHEYTPENTSFMRNEARTRLCKTCARERVRAAIAAETPEQARRRLDVGLKKYYASRESKGIVKKWSPEYLEKLSAANKGKRPSDAALRASAEARKKDNCPAGHPYAIHGMKSKKNFTVCKLCRAMQSRQNHERERRAREAETPEQKADRLRKRKESRVRNREKILVQKREYAARTREQRRAYDRDPVNHAKKRERRARARAEARVYG